MKKFRCLVIDDEEPARSLVCEFLTDYEAFEIIGEASNGLEGVHLINELKPDVVFLDIQMPKLTGFEVLELIDHNPKIVFSTAFDQYAIKAFEKNAIDYLLKPYSKERFAKAIDKLINDSNEGSQARVLSRKISESSDSEIEIINRIAIRNGTQIKIIPVDDVSYFESDDDYVRIHVKDSEFLKEKTMKYFETHLDSSQFIRIHRSYILNVNELDRIERYEKDNYIAILKDESRLKVSSSGYKTLRNNLKF